MLMEKIQTENKDILLVKKKINIMETTILLINVSVNHHKGNTKKRSEIGNIIARSQQK